MTIINKNSGILYKDMYIGTIFKYRDKIYMKTSYIKTYSGSEINAVNLETGVNCMFYDDVTLTPVNASITIQ